MKLTLTSLLAFALLFAVSCKKDKDSGVEQLKGDYNIYLVVVEDPDDGPLQYPLPTADGIHAKMLVNVNKDSSMSVKVLQFSKQNDTLSQFSMTGRVKKLASGDLRFVNGNSWLGTFGNNSELEVYPDAETTIYGRK